MRMDLFGLGGPELLVIAAAATFILGPDKIAAMAKDLGKDTAQLKNIPKEFREGVEAARPSAAAAEVARTLGRDAADVKQAVQDVVPEVASAVGEVQKGAQQISGEFTKGVAEGNRLAEDVQKDIPAYAKAARAKIIDVKADVGLPTQVPTGGAGDAAKPPSSS